MTTIYADFNARTPDDRVRLDTLGSQQSIQQAAVEPGMWVWLTDKEVRAGGLVQQSADGLVARVAWETVEHVPTSEDLADTDKVASALRELQALMSRPDRDHRRVLALLPLVEHRFQPGRADYVRSRVAQAFGHPHLALVAIDQAIASSPDTPGFIHHWLDLLRGVDIERAFSEAKTLVADAKQPAVVLAACASIYAARARELDGAALEEVERELLRFTARFDKAPGRETAPASVATMVHVTRGFALLHLGERQQAMCEFTTAIQLDPSSAEAYAAIGIETYPSAESVGDLESAVRLGAASFWPAYHLAHHHVDARHWAEAERFCDASLLLGPPARVRANLMEWRAIARFQQGDTIEQTRMALESALALAPNNARLRRNLELLLQPAKPRAEVPWRVECDAKGDPADAQAAA